MELCMPIPNQLKGPRIFYEGPLPAKREPAIEEFNRVFRETVKDIKTAKKKLTIIDPFFLAVEAKDAKDTVGMFQQLLDGIEFDELEIYYRNFPPKEKEFLFFHKRTFQQELQEQFSKVRISIKRMTKKVHDRFWIYNGMAGIIVGTSLNGIGSRFSFAMQIPEADLKELIEALKAYKIEVKSCQP